MIPHSPRAALLRSILADLVFGAVDATLRTIDRVTSDPIAIREALAHSERERATLEIALGHTRQALRVEHRDAEAKGKRLLGVLQDFDVVRSDRDSARARAEKAEAEAALFLEDRDKAEAFIAGILRVRPLEEADEVTTYLWWRFPVEEPPFVGSILSDDFPAHVTHFSELQPIAKAIGKAWR